MDKTAKRLKRLAVFTFFLAPVFAWGSVIASDETAVFASLSRMIWYSGSSIRIFIAMAVMFIPMLISFFHVHYTGSPRGKQCKKPGTVFGSGKETVFRDPQSPAGRAWKLSRMARTLRCR